MSGTGRIGAAIALVTLALAAWYWWPGSEEARVRARLEAIAAAASSSPGEAPMTRLARIAGLRDDLTADVVLEGPGGLRVEGADRVVAMAGARAQAPRGVEVRLADLEVAIDAGGGLAEVRGVVEVRDDDGGGDARDVTGTLRRDPDGRWRLARIAVVDPLERPQPAH